MPNLNYELSLLNSPYFDNLLTELKIILEQKKKLLTGIRNSKDFNEKLSFAEIGIYGFILKREEKLLLELVNIKGWSISDSSIKEDRTNLMCDFDVYGNSSLSNFV
jgi:hypothetical protein